MPYKIALCKQSRAVITQQLAWGTLNVYMHCIMFSSVLYINWKNHWIYDVLGDVDWRSGTDDLLQGLREQTGLQVLPDFQSGIHISNQASPI